MLIEKDLYKKKEKNIKISCMPLYTLTIFYVFHGSFYLHRRSFICYQINIYYNFYIVGNDNIKDIVYVYILTKTKQLFNT